MILLNPLLVLLFLFLLLGSIGNGGFGSGALIWIITFAFIFHPIRNYVYSITDIKVPGIVRGIVVFLLFIIGIGINRDMAEERAREQAREDKEKLMAIKQQNIDNFNNNKTNILAAVKESFDKGDFETVIASSEIYLPTNDKELTKFYEQAQFEIGKVKTKEILKLLKSVPVSQYEKNKDLYHKLVIYNPHVTKYKIKFKFYNEKLKEQKLRHTKAAEDYKKALKTPEEFVKIIKQSWRKDGFGTIAVVNLTVENTAPINVKDIILRCRFYGNSGTELNSKEKQIYETIKSNETKRLKNIELGFVNSQVTKGGCRVGFAKIAE